MARPRALTEAAGRDPAAVEVTVAGPLGPGSDGDALGAAGVDRLIVTPWTRSRDAVAGLRALAAEIFG